MAVDPNTKPIYAKGPNIAWAKLTTANTAKDGTGAVYTLLEGANIVDVSEHGTRALFIRFLPEGENPENLARIFLNNGSDNSNEDNNCLIGEVKIPSGINSDLEPNDYVDWYFPDEYVVLPGYKINVAITQASANGIHAHAYGGNY